MSATEERTGTRRDAGGLSDVDRAEELVEAWGERIGGWVAETTARVREEAEDMWAEAQSLRRGDR
jgi:hypothetical protein